MSDNHELFKTMVEKVKNDEELSRAMYATPIRDQWRQIIVVTLFITIVAGTFISRTKRFKAVMGTIESSPMLTKLTKKQAPADTTPVESNQQVATKKTTAYEGIDGGKESEDTDIAALREGNEAIAAKMDKLSKIAPSEIVPMSAAINGPAPASPAGEPLLGIGNKTPEPELDAFSTVVAPPPAYREEKQLPSAYAREKVEFPDLL